jgi:drug/metabolite transporter (DMT)-like permease
MAEATADSDPSHSLSEEWSSKAIDTVDTVVDVVHDKVVRPALIAGRAVVFGVVIAFLSLLLVVLLAVGLVRLLDVYAFGGRVWASDALIGLLCCGGGFVLWTKGTKRHSTDS